MHTKQLPDREGRGARGGWTQAWLQPAFSSLSPSPFFFPSCLTKVGGVEGGCPAPATAWGRGHGGSLVPLCSAQLQKHPGKEIDQQLLQNRLFAGRKLVTPNRAFRMGKGPSSLSAEPGLTVTEEGVSLGKINAARYTQTRCPSVFIQQAALLIQRAGVLQPTLPFR